MIEDRREARVTRHFDVEIQPAFDIEGQGTMRVTGKGGVKLVIPIKGTDTPEQVGAKLGAALRVLETGTARDAQGHSIDVVLGGCGGC